MSKPGKAGRSRGRALTLTKIVVSFAVIAVIGAAAALTGASATPSSGPEGPTVKHLPPVAPAVFDGSVRNLPQIDRPGKRDIPKPRPWQNEELEPALLAKTTLPGAKDVPAAADLADAAAPGPGSGAFAGTFPGLDSANWGAGWPPDTNGDVGPTYFIQAVNTSIGIFRKTDGARVAAFTFDTLFSGTGSLCDNDNGGDPTVTYDPVHDRWFVADFAFSGDGSAPPYYECIAVSKSGDPVAGGWYFYAVRADDSAHPWFPDYPKMGIWPDGLYMTANMFGNSFQEVRGWAFNLDDMTSGAPLRSAVVDTNTTTYFSLLPSNMRTVAGAPPAGRPNLFVAESQTAFGLQVFKFHVDWSGSGSTFTGPTNVSHSSYTVAASTAASPANPLDTLRERLMNSAQYANVNGVESLWVNHTIRCCGTTNGPAGIQWIQVNVTGGNVGATPIQQQVYPGASDGLNRWMGSVAVDKLGDMALGYSVSSSTLNPDIRYAGRLAGDPLGTLPQTETSMLPGVTRGTQLGNCGGATCTRWGDYSGMTIDPNGCDFWFTTEYYSTTGMNWQTRVGSFRLNPSCTPVGGGGQQSQTIIFDPLPAKVYGDADFAVAATASSGLPVSFAAAGNCTVSASAVHLTGAGSCTVTASQAGDATYAPATPVSRTFAIGKADQTISFGPLPTRTFGDPDFTVSATASSGLPVSFAASGSCTVSGSTVHLTASGSCTITASQGGDANYNAAAGVPQTFTINPGQSSGTPLTLSSTVEGNLDFSPGAWVNGGFAVKLAQQNSASVTVQVTGNVLLPVHCSDAAGNQVTTTISVPVSRTVTIPAGSTSWTPTNDQKSILGWMGAVQAPVCGAGGVMHNTEGATLSVTVVAGAHTGALSFQFHYRVPAAKGKPNTNCTVAGDPSHNTACSAKWSSSKSI